MIVTILLLDKENRRFNPQTTNVFGSEKNFNIIRASSIQEAIYNLKNTKISVIISLENDNNKVHEVWQDVIAYLPNYWINRWLNFYNAEAQTDSYFGTEIMKFYLRSVNSTLDYFSIITPLFETADYKFDRLYSSLKNQVNKNWEWILIDDSIDTSKTDHIKEKIKNDIRIKYYNLGHSGIIGEVKRNGFSLATGIFLVEVDHDDELLPTALERILIASKKFPDAGFFYSNCAEIELDDNLEPKNTRNYARSPEGYATKGSWGFSGTGTAEEFTYKGYKLLSCVPPEINSQSIRHITSSPNHFRCWKRDAYLKAGMHNPNIHVSDDYELMVKTFLTTKMVHIDNTEYLQFYDNTGNTQYNRNAEIQRMTDYISKHYDEAIHERFLELGISDYCWNEEFGKGLYRQNFPEINPKEFKANYRIKF